jgi:hypothetical protein
MAFDAQAMTEAIEDILKNDPRITTAQFLVVRSEPIDEQPEGRPVVGIYKSRESYEPHTIAAGQQPWRITGTPELVLLTSSLKSGADADSRFEEAKKLLFTVLGENLTLGGTVAMLNGWEMEYEYGKDGGHYFVGGTITLHVEARA